MKYVIFKHLIQAKWLVFRTPKYSWFNFCCGKNVKPVNFVFEVNKCDC